MYLHRYNFLEDQIREKGEDSKTLIIEVRRQERGFTVFVIDRAPIHMLNARMSYDTAFWNEDEAREVVDEANNLAEAFDKNLFVQLGIKD